jgi:hypothetical protein
VIAGAPPLEPRGHGLRVSPMRSPGPAGTIRT